MMSKLCQILQVDSWGHKEKFLFLDQLQNLKGLQVINSGTKSKLKLPQILKGFKLFWKNLINSIKVYIPMVDLIIILHWHTCIQILKVPLQVGICT
jgi:hypothetical protein